jgi:hypothetical protein
LPRKSYAILGDERGGRQPIGRYNRFARTAGSGPTGRSTWNIQTGETARPRGVDGDMLRAVRPRDYLRESRAQISRWSDPFPDPILDADTVH